jgi:hypothetical protein
VSVTPMHLDFTSKPFRHALERALMGT